ncbi:MULTISPECIES: hypothetical protein [Streptomyces]|uniref:Uncharacterized protein n=1 Tax=Streptomyces carpaticus TaxID=285558 RepID=A0ABV4ZIH6_9ACTN|nr:hypothetical protein [Streptomyces harbinensis]
MPRSRWTDHAARAVLACVYFLVVTPAGLCVRLIRDPLHGRRRGRAPSYWEEPPDERPATGEARR